MDPARHFDFSNLTGRKSGPFVRLGAILLPGVRKVQRQIKPYAAAWEMANQQTLETSGPLWVVLGDSMAQGVGGSAYDKGWPGQLAAHFAATDTLYRMVNLSQSGARIRDVLDVQLPAMERLGVQPKLVTVMIGSNDLSRKKFRIHALDDYVELLERLPNGSVVANLQGRGIPAEMAGMLAERAAAKNFVIADVRRHGPHGWAGKTAEDHFHPNDVGYAELTRAFVIALSK